MRLLSCLFACVVSLSVALYANDWSQVVSILEQSAVYVNSADGSCTGFVINAHAREKGDKDFVLTAAHCDGKELFAAHVPAVVVFKDEKKDLLILEVDDLDKPALKLAATDAKIGDEVASYGYGYNLERSMFRIAHVSDVAMYIPEGGVGGPFMMIDAAFVPGQSGGPVVNLAGEVVLIVQRGSDSVGIGVGADIIRASVGRYFDKSVK